MTDTTHTIDEIKKTLNYRSSKTQEECCSSCLNLVILCDVTNAVKVNFKGHHIPLKIGKEKNIRFRCAYIGISENEKYQIYTDHVCDKFSKGVKHGLPQTEL